MADDERMMIIVKIGSMNISSGIGGNDAPSRVLLNKIKGRNPVVNGVLENPADFEQLILGAVGEDLNCAEETTGILVCDLPLMTQEHRKLLAAVLFDTFHFPAVLFYNRLALSALAACRTHGLVVELGDEHSYVMPVISCEPQRGGLQVGPVAGRQLSAMLNDLLKASAQLDAPLSSYDMGSLKRRIDVLPTKAAFEAAVAAAAGKPDTMSLMNALKTADGKTLEDIPLPPMHLLQGVPEALFQPSLVPSSLRSSTGANKSLAQLVVDAVQSVESDMQPIMYANIVLAGRGAMYKGLKERLTNEVRSLTPPGTDVEVLVEENCPVASWVGGSTLASMRSTTDNGFVTKEHWDTYGPAIFDTWSTN